MPPCNKELKVYATKTNFLKEDPAVLLFCIKGEGHETRHEYQVWTDEENDVTGNKGVIKFLH